ncbi:ABC transporter permease [Thermopolyspora sp. NPDC052614]|uniref:ABC transporter permease n=1 Tax=Thermopolyspora sp. NPDC052614 TaxID=3155682 RepID=UPI003427C7D3
MAQQTAGRPARRWVDLRWRGAPVALPWAVALLMLVVSVAIFPSSISFGGLATMTPLLGVLIVASLGQSLVIGTGGIDLSVSSVVTVAGVVFVMKSAGDGASLPVAIGYAVGAGLLCGVANGVLVERVGLSPLVATLATGQVMAGLAHIWYSSGVNRLNVPAEWSAFTGATLGGGISPILVASVVLVALTSVVLGYTAVGRRLTAASTGPRAARYQGIAVRRYRVATYVVAALLYSVGGVLLVGSIGTPTLSLGDAYQLSTIVVVVLGGAALSGGRLHPAATLAGAVFLTFINQDVAATGVAPGTQGVIQGAVLVLAMLATGLTTGLSTARLLRRRRTGGTADAAVA